MEKKLEDIIDGLADELGKEKVNLREAKKFTSKLDKPIALNDLLPFGKKQTAKNLLIKKLGYDINYKVSGSFDTITRVIHYLKGLEIEDVGGLVKMHPSILEYTMESRIKPSVDYLKSIGVRKKKDLRKMVEKVPRIIGYNVKKTLKPTHEFLRDKLGVTTKYIIDNPGVLTFSLKERIKPRYYFLKRVGLEEEYKAWSILSLSDNRFATAIAKVTPEEYQEFKSNYLKAA